MSIGLYDIFENILEMCIGSALGYVLELIVSTYWGDVLYESCQKPTRMDVNTYFVGYFDEKVLQMC